MKYMTVREAAEKWGVTEQLVQEYCVQGRIAGTNKINGFWEIPAETEEPGAVQNGEAAPVRGRQKAVYYPGLMPLMNTSFEPGHCMECIMQMEEGSKKEIALAEYHYFSGQAEKASMETELYLTAEDTDIRLSACWIYAYANLSLGYIHKTWHALSEVKNILAADTLTSSEAKAAQAFVAAAAAVLLHLPLPEGFPPIRGYLSLLSPGVQMFALYVQAHYNYLQGDYGRSLGVVETALALQAEAYPIPAIYLHLIAVMDYMGLKQPKQAQEHLLAAWNLAKPDDLIEGFGEHHGLLGGMLEAVIKKDWPEDFKRIIAITYRFSAGWRKIHNSVTGHNVADNLTTTEFAAAMLAARGWTNQEIGDHMNISPNTVKRYISTALQKLNISHRQDLKKYLLR